MIEVAIASRCSAPEWCTLFEVSNAAGFNRSRSADAVAMNMYPSRGLCVHGFEVKRSRSDWLRELKSPEKSEPVQKYCDRWWIAVTDDDIVKVEELPETWGLLVLRGKRLVQKVEAPKLTAQPIDRHFTAAMLKRATLGTVPQSALTELVNKAVDERAARYGDTDKRVIDQLTKRLDESEETIRKFEAASGVSLRSRWGGQHSEEKVGRALRSLLDRSLLTKAEPLLDVASRCHAIAEEAEKLAAFISTPIENEKESA